MPPLDFLFVSQIPLILFTLLLNLLKPKHQGSGLEMEANLTFEDYYLNSQCTDIIKRGIYVQVSYRGMFKDYFELIHAIFLSLGLTKSVYFSGT